VASGNGEGSGRTFANSENTSGIMVETSKAQSPDELRRETRLTQIRVMLALGIFFGLAIAWGVDHFRLTRTLIKERMDNRREVASLWSELAWAKGRIKIDGPESIAFEHLTKHARALFSADPVGVVLNSPMVKDDDVAKLVEFPTLRFLSIWTNSNELSDDCVRHLQDLPNLETVWIHGPWITDQTLLHLGRLDRLTFLGIYNTGISDAGLMHLGKMTSLKRMALRDSGRSDSSMAIFRQFPALTELTLDDNALTDASIPLLGMLSNLKNLRLVRTQITADGISKLESLLPDCRIRHELKWAAWPMTTAPAAR
jgi:hypothetical protein